ncbi:proliferation-associated 2g4 [Strigomonas culicis]|uniref:Proliferation-associated 2g4 n=1 Tax=Strigomonas culicis TaxID=28005 RepID=S9TXE7_9TRYP|nr:proliferation-associated 2g4 [Strigomonas culicis]|eukprot:EPY21318.1 proliferation-associated 2g4 [Strigomonas culicis]
MISIPLVRVLSIRSICYFSPFVSQIRKNKTKQEEKQTNNNNKEVPMGRGYAVSRSRSARPTLRMKRERSVSLHKLDKATSGAGGATITPSSTAAPQEGDGRRKIVVRRRSASAHAAPPASSAVHARSRSRAGAAAATTAGTATPRQRSASVGALLSEKVHRLEQKLQAHLEDSEDDEESTRNHDVMNKYIAVGKAVEEVLQLVAAACVPGASTKALCDLGDQELQQRVKMLFQRAREDGGAKKQRLPRGLCFPTNVSVNEVLCHHSPFRDSEATVLRGNDVVKVHLGAHLDGYPVSAARTIFVPATADAAGTPLDVSAIAAYEAARRALQVLLATIAPDTLNVDLTDAIATVGRSYRVEALEGVLSHRVKRWVPDCLQASIINRRIVMTEPQQDVADCVLEAGQVWSLDVAFTNNGCANPRYGTEASANEEDDAPPPPPSPSALPENFYFNKVKPYKLVPVHNAEVCIFRRRPEDLPEDSRVQQANETLDEINRLFYCFPFHFKHFVDQPLRYKLGLNVLCKQKIMDTFAPLQVKKVYDGGATRAEKDARTVITTRFAATVVLTNKKVTILCGAPPLLPPPVADALLPPPASELVAQFHRASGATDGDGLAPLLAQLEAAERDGDSGVKGMPKKLLEYAQREYTLPTHEAEAPSGDEEEIVEVAEAEEKKKKDNHPHTKEPNQKKGNANNKKHQQAKKKKQKKTNEKTGEKAAKASRVE